MQHRRQVAWLVVAAGALGSAWAMSEEATPTPKLLFAEDFAGDLSNWWVEGGERVWLEQGRLHMKADPPEGDPRYVCTVWCKQPFPADLRIDLDAQVVASSLGANNINLFFCYADPTGRSLYETRDQRAEAAYRKYHDLQGHIVTFLRDFKHEGGRHEDGTTKARLRLRRCPGFELLTECFDGHCEQGVTYHLTVVKEGGRLTVSVDGKQYLTATDPQPLGGGLLGLRTFRTHLWWDNLRVTALHP